MLTRSRTLLAGPLVAILLFGCGGDGDSSPPSRSSSTKAEFVRRANAICRSERTDLPKEEKAFLARRKGSVASDPTLYLTLMRFVVLPTIELELLKIEQLDPPKRDEVEIDEMLFAQQRGIDEIAVRESLSSMEIAEREFAEANRLLRAYGLTECAFDSRPRA